MTQRSDKRTAGGPGSGGAARGGGRRGAAPPTDGSDEALDASGVPEAVEGELVDDPSAASEGEDEDEPELVGDAELAEPGRGALLELPGEGEEDGEEGAVPVLDEPGRGSTALVPRRERGLGYVDPLQRYIDEIRRYSLLSREEEHELAVRYAETGDPAAARQLVTANLRLVVKIAHEYRRAHRNLLDLIQEGNLGLVQAVKKYDPYRGVKLSSYSAWWIRAYMLKFILNNWRLVKIGTTQAQRKLFFNLRKERDKLLAMGIDATPQAIAEALDVPERDVIEMERRLGQGELSLDAPVGHDDDGSSRSQLDFIESSGELRPDVRAEGEEFQALLREKLLAFEETLQGREQTIFRERLLNESPKTLQEIGDEYGISRERARQLEKRLTARLKDYLKAELGDAVQVAMGLDES